MDWLKPLVALLAIVNPIGAVPFFIHFTQAMDRTQRRRTIQVSATTAFAVIAISGLAGLKIIEFFGISIASFQVGGGLLLIAGPALVEQFAAGLPQLGEHRAERLQARQHRGVPGRHLVEVVGGEPVLLGRAAQLRGHDGDAFCHR